jgi:hypothetical protein
MWTIAEVAALAVVAVVVMAIAPAFVAFAVAASSAGVWCWWLEAHPESREASAELSRR